VAPGDGLKHNPFASLRGALPAAEARAAKTAPAPVAGTPLGRVIVREELDGGAAVTRLIGVPPALCDAIGRRFRDALGGPVLVEGRDLLLATGDVERVAASLRDAGASEVKIVRRTPEAASAGQPGGTVRAQIRRGLRVAVVQKADQESGALTEGVVREILTSAPVHPRGIKVRLESGEVGRVRRLLSP
jgi:uncharacterized repeat protein (TIGR03833 family)